MKSLLRTAINRFPSLKVRLEAIRSSLTSADSVSSHYVEMAADEVGPAASELRDSWQAVELPQRQRELVDGQLQAYRDGQSIDVFDVFARSLRSLPAIEQGASVLEIGCSSGFYSEVLQIVGLPLQYTGCDYAESFIALARERYPGVTFDVEDATRLSYADCSFDIVISGCCLLHIPEFTEAIAETARVAREYVVFHRTPVLLGKATTHYRKRAYGVETMEIHFNEAELLALFEQYGLEMHATFTLEEKLDSMNPKSGSANRTYVCKRRAQ